MASLSSDRNWVKLIPSSGCPPRSGAPGYSCLFSALCGDDLLERFVYPVKIYPIKCIFSEEAKQIPDELRSVTGGADDVAEHGLSSCTVVGKSPSAKGNDGLQATVLLF